jgi:hypothetical protein
LCDLSSTIELGIPTVIFVTEMPVWLFWAADAGNPKRAGYSRPGDAVGTYSSSAPEYLLRIYHARLALRRRLGQRPPHGLSHADAGQTKNGPGADGGVQRSSWTRPGPFSSPAKFWMSEGRKGGELELCGHRSRLMEEGPGCCVGSSFRFGSDHRGSPMTGVAFRPRPLRRSSRAHETAEISSFPLLFLRLVSLPRACGLMSCRRQYIPIAGAHDEHYPEPAKCPSFERLGRGFASSWRDFPRRRTGGSARHQGL